jgi:hypothetical protein
MQELQKSTTINS